MITLVQRLWGWLRHLLTFVERGEDRSEEWPHTVADIEPPKQVRKLDLFSYGPVLNPPHPDWKIELVDGELPEGAKVFDDGLVGVPHPLKTLADYADVDKLRAVYGATIPDAQLRRWALEAQNQIIRSREVNDRLWEIESQPAPEVPDSGYRPAGGIDAGTSPKTGIVMPPAVEDLTTREWCDLRLEKAYGIGQMPLTLAPGRSGFSMRHLNALARRAEQRDATLSAYDIAILRSRGLV